MAPHALLRDGGHGAFALSPPPFPWQTWRLVRQGAPGRPPVADAWTRSVGGASGYGDSLLE